MDHQKALLFIEALRKPLIRVGIVTAVLAIGGYCGAETVIVYLQAITGVKLVAYGLPDTFFSFLKIGLALGFTATMPYALYAVFGILPDFFPGFSRRLLLGFWAASLLFFGLGVLFCLKVSLPYGIQFLLSFETSTISALISVEKFVSFCFWIIFGFGFIFELPLIMMLLSSIGLVNAKQLGAYRRYAFIAILVIAAVLTPTPDIFNMMLMAVPLYTLFEIGLLGMRIWHKKEAGPEN